MFSSQHILAKYAIKKLKVTCNQIVGDMLTVHSL